MYISGVIGSRNKATRAWPFSWTRSKDNAARLPPGKDVPEKPANSEAKTFGWRDKTTGVDLYLWLGTDQGFMPLRANTLLAWRWSQRNPGRNGYEG